MKKISEGIMYEAREDSRSHSVLFLEEELMKLLDVEINILDQRKIASKSLSRQNNFQKALKKLTTLRNILLKSISPINFEEFKEYTNFIIETIELSMNNYNLIKFSS